MDLSDKENMTSKLIHAREPEDTIARRRSPIMREMFIEIAHIPCNSDHNSAVSITFDRLALERILGLWAAKGLLGV